MFVVLYTEPNEGTSYIGLKRTKIRQYVGYQIKFLPISDNRYPNLLPFMTLDEHEHENEHENKYEHEHDHAHKQESEHEPEHLEEIV